MIMPAYCCALPLTTRTETRLLSDEGREYSYADFTQQGSSDSTPYVAPRHGDRIARP